MYFRHLIHFIVVVVFRKRARQAEDKRSFGNEVYSVKLVEESTKQPPLFGAKYDFHLEGVVDCPEFLVYVPVLEK